MIEWVCYLFRYTLFCLPHLRNTRETGRREPFADYMTGDNL